MEKTLNQSGINRRQFLLASSGICFGFVLPTPLLANTSTPQKNGELTAWVSIGKDNKITIMSPAAEMGQGSMTSIPMIFAEELDANWHDVSIEFSPSDDVIFKNPTSWVQGIMLTLGSSAVSGYYDTARLYGALARKILLSAAAKRWHVPLEELETEPSTVIHRPSSRRYSYGEVAQLVHPSAPLPTIDETDLKDESNFRIIGSDIHRYDIPDKVAGSPIFSIDIDLPDMVFATVTHSPVKGGTPLKIKNAKLIAKRPNILRLITLPDAVAIVARTYEAAYEAEKILDIEWSTVDKLLNFSDSRALETHLQLIREPSQNGITVQQQGNINDALKNAKKQYQAEYLSDYLYHAQMEPLNAVAHVLPGGKGVEIWAGTQAPTHCVRAAAKELGIEEKSVTLHRTHLGGGFGRRGAMDQDFVIDAVQVSREMQLPVKVIWSRESDVKTGRFKPIKAMLLQAGENSEGKLTAWRHRTASDEGMKQADPYRYEKAGGWPILSSSGMEIDYDIENISAEIFDPDTGVRTSALRGIGGTLNKFAAESFIDEIAIEKNIDPLKLRLQLLHQHPTALRTLNKVAEMSDWYKQTKNAGLGIAFDSVYYPTAVVAKVTVNKNNGLLKVTKIWITLDVGLAVHPKNILGQIEGQVIYAISNVLKERITITNGVVDQSNFHDYPFMRINEIPEIEIELLTQKNSKPKGVGDSRLAAVPAAIGNAFANLTGKRLRHLPFTSTRVKQTLNS